MKTKDLIRALQEADPSGENECCVGNCDITSVHPEAAYWDGALQVILRDASGRRGFAGAKYTDEGTKIIIHTTSITDLVFHDPSFPVCYSELSESRSDRYREGVEKVRRHSVDFHVETEWEWFIKHVRKRAADLTGELDGLEAIARKFYDAHIDWRSPIPKDIPVLNESYVSRRNIQWEREIEITHDGFQIVLTKKE